MELIVNGEQKKYDEPMNVKELVELEVEGNFDRLAVAVNSTVICQNDWSERKLEAGDEVEIVRPLQGG